MIEVIPITTGEGLIAFAFVSQSINAFRHRSARFFGFVAASNGATRGAARYVTSVATTIENIALSDTLVPTTTSADAQARAVREWFTVCIRRIQEQLGSGVDDRTAAVCLGIAYRDDDNMAVSIAPSGASAAIMVLHGRRASRVVSILKPTQQTKPFHFAHALDGTMDTKDCLVIGTDTLTVDAVRDAIAAYCVQRTPDALAHLRSRLQEHGQQAAAVIVTGARPTHHSQASMNSFLATAASTERFLTPSLGPMLKNYFAQLRATTRFMHLPRRHRGRRSPTPRVHGQLLPLAVHAIRLAFQTIAVAAKSIGAMLLDGIRLVRLACIHATMHVAAYRMRAAQRREAASPALPSHTRRERQPPPPPTPRVSLRERLTLARATEHGRAIGKNLHAWFRSLPPASQRLFLLTIVFAALFIGSTVALWQRRTHDREISAYNATIAKIDDLRSMAESNMLYDDRTAARDALAQVAALIETLPRDSRARRAQGTLLREELQASFDRARMITRVDDPLRVARVGEHTPIPFSGIAGGTILGTTIVLFASDLSQIAIINPKDGSVVIRTLQPAPRFAEQLRIIPLDDRSLFLIDKNSHTAIIDTLTGTTNIAVIEQPPAGTRDAAVFQKRLYLLHEDGGITRHNRTASGFSRGSSWLDASDATRAFARLLVTGAVFVSGDDGALHRYLSGRQSNEDLLRDVDPPIADAVSIVGIANGDRIYLGDPTEGRVIALTDTGSLIAQVRSRAFLGMLGIAVTPDERSLFIFIKDSVAVIVPPR